MTGDKNYPGTSYSPDSEYRRFNGRARFLDLCDNNITKV